MSGGHFEYKQYTINSIVESIDAIIDNNDDESLDEFGYKLVTGIVKIQLRSLKLQSILSRKPLS
jgi:hypothetical protein